MRLGNLEHRATLELKWLEANPTKGMSPHVVPIGHIFVSRPAALPRLCHGVHLVRQLRARNICEIT